MRSIGQRFRPKITNRLDKKTIDPLVQQGPRRIQHLAYRLVFLGAIWDNPGFKKSRQHLEDAFKLAVGSKKLNSVFCQYFAGGSITVRPLESTQLDVPNWMPTFSTYDAEKLLVALHAKGQLQIGPLKVGPDMEEQATFFILPPGTVLIGPGGKENTLDDGLHAFHFHYRLPSENATVYYAATAWGDGAFGIGKHGWVPWQNTCAMLYHELSETLTNPDVDTVEKANKGWFVGPPGDEQEIADLAILYYGDHPLSAFKLAADESGEQVPIQLLWSNDDKGPWDPSRAAGPHKACRQEAAKPRSSVQGSTARVTRGRRASRGT